VKKIAIFSAAALCLGSFATSAYAKPVGSMTCSNIPQFNISSYNLGLTQTLNIGSQSSGSGAGKVVLQPLDVHASIAQFSQLFRAATIGSSLGTCKLTVNGNDGASVVFEFKLVAVKSLTVEAASGNRKDEEAAAYTDIQLQYGAIDVLSTPGKDDGGTTPISAGWNQITNSEDPYSITQSIAK
jgi:type VI protein secretion system component Hcp